MIYPISQLMQFNKNMCRWIADPHLGLPFVPESVEEAALDRQRHLGAYIKMELQLIFRTNER